MTVVYGAFTALLVLFGAVIMMLEILSSNLMSPYFGGSVFIWGSIISSIMVHLSVGYVLGGYFARKAARTTTLLLLLAAGSVWVILIPFFHPPVCEFIANAIEDVRYGSLAAMNVIFFVPITIMAMVSPYVIGILAEYRRRSRLTAGMILFISTIGSFVGTNVTAFYLINLFPVSGIVRSIGILCLAVSLALLFFRIDDRLRAGE
ncbi:MAG: fused MFS/spermidine synthase [Syntrophales bacterium]|jgi:MFS family permease|nr:fused MFS/spermidine synthase [Syntrophales bacterium]